MPTYLPPQAFTSSPQAHPHSLPTYSHPPTTAGGQNGKTFGAKRLILRGLGLPFRFGLRLRPCVNSNNHGGIYDSVCGKTQLSQKEAFRELKAFAYVLGG
jgi:hypothetical protein